MIKIERLEIQIPVYDITVKDNHNFYANDILVHNCQEITLPTVPMATHVKSQGSVKIEDAEPTFMKFNANPAFEYKVTGISDGLINYELVEDKSEIALCTLAAINLGNVKSLDSLDSICRNAVRMLDNLLDYQDYMVVAAKTSTMRYRPLGIGITNLAYYLAKNGVTYSSPDGHKLVHDTMEAIEFYCIKASIELAKERGPCLAYENTKWSEGIMPIDHYNKHVDDIVPNNLNLDWKWLRKELKKYGIRNATLTAMMPAESSSRIFNSTNGVEPVRSLITVKSNKQHVTKQVVPEYMRLKKKYDMLWDMIDMDGIIKTMAVIQKFTCQSISTNLSYNPEHFENGEIPMSTMLRDVLKANYYGLKTLYYHNTRDGREDEVVENKVKKIVEVATVAEEIEDAACDACAI